MSIQLSVPAQSSPSREPTVEAGGSDPPTKAHWCRNVLGTMFPRRWEELRLVPVWGPCSQCPRRGLLHNGRLSLTLGSHPHLSNLSESSRKATFLGYPVCWVPEVRRLSPGVTR